MSADPLVGEIAGPGNGPPLSGPGVTPPSLSGAGRRFLSDILVELGFVDAAAAEQAVEAARHPGQTPEKVLLESGAITEDQLARALAERYGLDHIDLIEFAVDQSAAALLRKTAAKRYQAAPVGFSDDGALVLGVADPADSLGLSDIAVMTKLPVRPAVAARSQILKLLDTLVFMEEPAQGASESVSTVIVPPDGEGAGNSPTARSAEPPAAAGRAAAMGDDGNGRELAVADAAAEDALRAERASAQQALTSLRAKHEQALEAERAKRVEEVEAERERAAAAIDAERERNQKELEALRTRLTEELDAARADLDAAREQAASPPPADAGRIEQLERSLAGARDQLVLTADADRRAEAARAALAALRDESERQAQVHALTERELRADLERVRGELESLKAELAQATRQ
jgi:hypothetical protein